VLQIEIMFADYFVIIYRFFCVVYSWNFFLWVLAKSRFICSSEMSWNIIIIAYVEARPN